MTALDQLLLVCSVFPVAGQRQYQCRPLPSKPDLQRLSQGTSDTNRNREKTK